MVVVVVVVVPMGRRGGAGAGGGKVCLLSYSFFGASFMWYLSHPDPGTCGTTMRARTLGFTDGVLPASTLCHGST